MTLATGKAASLTDNPLQNPHQETTMFDSNVRRVLDGTSIAHLASVLPDGAPHSVPVRIDTHGDHVAILTGPDTRKP